MIDPLTLDQLRVFVAVVDSGSFSAASRRLQRVQSAVSHAVQALETTLGVTLFDRTGRTPVLTEAGEALLGDARGLLAAAAGLRAKAASFSEGVEPELSVAVDPFFPLEAMMDGLRHVAAVFPSMRIRLITEGIGGPERHLRNGSVSLAIFPREISPTPDLVARFLVNIEMISVVASSHPLACAQSPITQSELNEVVQLVLSNDTSNGWSRGVVSPRIWRFADLHTRIEFLLAGFGWCNMPRHLVAEPIRDGRLTQLTLQESIDFRVALHAVHLQSYSPGPGARVLLSRLAEQAI